jgi:hypothetical protein
MAFFRRIIMPLLPKTALLSVESEGVVQTIKIISGVDESQL